MSYAILTVDDFMGLLPFLSILGFLLYGMGRCLVGCKNVCFGNNTEQVADNGKENDSCLSSTRQRSHSNFHTKSIIFMLFLSYLLSPLSTLFHLKGKRWNKQLYQQYRSRSNASTTSNNTIASSSFGLYDLIHGTDPQLNTLMAHMPSLLRGPRPPLLFANRHLQFIPWLLQNEFHRQNPLPYQRIDLPVTACGDKSIGAIHCQHPDNRPELMTDTITLDVFPPFDDINQHYPQFHSGSPIIFVSPGLRCNSHDLPGTMMVRRAYAAGFRTIVVHRRGHTPDQPLQAPRWNLFGDVDDLEQVYWYIADNYAARHTPFFLHGISSGTATVVSALAEWDARNKVYDSDVDDNNHTTTKAKANNNKAPSFVGSVSITPGYDISKVFEPTRFKIPYNPILVQSVKDHFIKPNEGVLRDYHNDAVDQALSATNLQDLLNAVAPFAGYPNASAYYVGENPVNNVQDISTPALILNSIDDPCCNVHNLYETSPYPHHHGKTYAQIVSESPRGLLAVTATGSHCPFLDTSTGGADDDKSYPINNIPILNRFLPGIVQDPVTGGWMLDSWADRVSIEFYQAALRVYGEERRHMQ